MPTAGPNSASTAGDSTENGAAVGNPAWSNPTNALVSDTNYATVVANGSLTHSLLITNFGFSIPAGSTLNGILVEVEAKCASGTMTPRTYIRKSPSNYMTSPASFSVSTTEAYISTGATNSTAAWGSFPPTITQVNSTDFGVGVDDGDISGTLSVNHVRVTIGYTPGGGGGSIIVTRQAVMRAATR